MYPHAQFHPQGGAPNNAGPPQGAPPQGPRGVPGQYNRFSNPAQMNMGNNGNPRMPQGGPVPRPMGQQPPQQMQGHPVYQFQLQGNQTPQMIIHHSNPNVRTSFDIPDCFIFEFSE